MRLSTPLEGLHWRCHGVAPRHVSLSMWHVTIPKYRTFLDWFYLNKTVVRTGVKNSSIGEVSMESEIEHTGRQMEVLKTLRVPLGTILVRDKRVKDLTKVLRR